MCTAVHVDTGTDPCSFCVGGVFMSMSSGLWRLAVSMVTPSSWARFLEGFFLDSIFLCSHLWWEIQETRAGEKNRFYIDGERSEHMFQKVKDIPAINDAETVWKAVDTHGQAVIMKCFRPKTDDHSLAQETIREIVLLKTLQPHDNIIKLVHVDEDVEFIIMEAMECDLHTYIQQYRTERKTIPLDTIQKFMYQLLRAVAHCHSHGIIHRDIKPAQLLLDKKKERLKLTDFDCGRKITLPPRAWSPAPIGTHGYMSPEVLLGLRHYTSAVDMWAVGCVMYELAQLVPFVYKTGTQIGQLWNMFQNLGTPTIDTWPTVLELEYFRPSLFPAFPSKRLELKTLDVSGNELLNRLLCCDPNQRISARQALVQPFFAALFPLCISPVPRKAASPQFSVPEYRYVCME
jgi:serine/threonine protein kinase